MTPEDLRKRTRTFAVDVIKLCRQLPRTDEARVISWQLLRAGTGVGANYRAVCRCRSAKDFISKLGVVIEEVDEATFWFDILADAGIVSAVATKRLQQEADELIRIFVRSRDTARRNRASRLGDRTTTLRNVNGGDD